MIGAQKTGKVSEIGDGKIVRTVDMDITIARLRKKSLRIAKLTVVMSWTALWPVGMMFY